MGIERNRRELLISAGAMGLLGFGGGAMAQAKAPVIMANPYGSPNNAMLELMVQQKFLEDFGLDPKLLNVADGSKIVSGLVGGDIDISTMSGFGQVLPAIEKGGRMKILAVAMLRVQGALFTSNADIKSLKDLEGRNVGTGAIGALLHQLVVALLKKKGVDHTKVNFVNIGSSVDVFRAVTAGTVDAGMGDVTYVDEQEKYKIRLIPESDMSTELGEYTYQGAYTTQAAIDTKRDVLVRTLAAFGKLYRFVHDPASKDAFLKARKTAVPTASNEENEALWRFIQRTKPFAANLVLTPERLDYMQKLNVELGVQQKALPFEQVADMSLARDAVKLLGGDI